MPAFSRYQGEVEEEPIDLEVGFPTDRAIDRRRLGRGRRAAGWTGGPAGARRFVRRARRFLAAARRLDRCGRTWPPVTTVWEVYLTEPSPEMDPSRPAHRAELDDPLTYWPDRSGGRRQLDLDGDRPVGWVQPISPVSRPTARRSASTACSRSRPSAAPVKRRGGDLGPHRHLGLRLRAPDRRPAPPPRRPAAAASPSTATSLGGRPGRRVDRALLPPRPDLLGHVRHDRREQPEHHVQGQAERGLGRGAPAGSRIRTPAPSPVSR